MGEDIAEKQELLNASVSAWNIACLKDDKRQQAINKFMKEYKKLNPTFTKDDFKDEEEKSKGSDLIIDIGFFTLEAQHPSKHHLAG